MTHDEDDRPRAVELYTDGGRPAGVYYCSGCRYVGPSELTAKTCCAPKTCEGCGGEYERRWSYSVCRACHAKREEKRRQERWDAAEKLSGWGWGDPVVTDGQEGSRDGYWASIDELRDWLDDEDLTFDDVRVYATKSREMKFCAADVIDRELERGDHYEDARDDLPDRALRELQEYLDEWCRMYGPTTYFEDCTRGLTFHDRGGGS